jgi:hypothetical protein
MASGILMGAGLGAGGAMLTGQDPLKGAALGGIGGGIGGAMSSAPLTSGAGAVAQGAAPSMLAQTGAQQATANASMGGLGANIGDGFSGFQDATGLTNRDMTQMAMNQMAKPPEQQQMQVPQMQIRQGQAMQGGGSQLSSNPRLRKQGLL